MAIYKRDIVDINLETGNIHRSFLKHSIGYLDQQADHFGIRVLRNGEPVDLTGVTVQGIFLNPQGTPIAITTGNIVEGNVAEVVLPQACYNYDGQFCLSIKLVDTTNTITGTMRIVDGMVDNTHASGTVAPTETVPTYQEILSVYADMVDALADVADYAANFAPAFAAGTANAAGSYVMYEGDLYLLPEGHTANTTWANTTKTKVNIGDQVSSLKSALGEKYQIVNGYFTSGAWSGINYSAFVKVTPGSSYTFERYASSSSSPYYGLKSVTIPPTVGDSPVFSEADGWTAGRSLSNNSTETGVIPSDVNWLYFYAGTNTNYTRLPTKIVINGISVLDSTVVNDVNTLAFNATKYADKDTANDIIQNYLALQYSKASSISATEESPADFNDFTTPGNYRVNSMAVATWISNKPTGVNVGGRLTVITNYSSSTIIQIYSISTSTKAGLYIRNKSENTWNDWQNITPTYDSTPTLNSDVPVTSNGIYNSNQAVIDKDSKQLINNNSFDAIARLESFYRPKDYTTDGVRFLWNDDNSKLTISGTATGTARYNIYYGASLLPMGIIPGSICFVKLDGWDSRLTLAISEAFSGADSAYYFYGNESGHIEISPDAIGMVIQIRVETGSVFGDGVTYNAPKIITAETNKILEQRTDTEIRINKMLISTNTHRMYTRDIIHTDGYTLLEMGEGYAGFITFYNSSEVSQGTSSEILAGQKYVINPDSYIRLTLYVDDNGSHPLITDFNLTDVLNKVKLYTPAETMRRITGNRYLNWTSASIFQNVGVIGDSWASGSMYHPDGSGWTGNLEMSWPQILGRECNINVVNFTHGGYDTKMWLNNSTYGLGKLLSTDPQQLYMIDLGINDYLHIHSTTTSHPLDLGTIADIKDDYTQNPDTFFGCYGKIIGNILNYAPDAKIVLMSVPRRTEREMDAYIKQIADKCGLPFIQLTDDLYFVSQHFYESVYEGHLASYSYGGMASAIHRLLCDCIVNNTEYFGTYYGTEESDDTAADD